MLDLLLGNPLALLGVGAFIGKEMGKAQGQQGQPAPQQAPVQVAAPMGAGGGAHMPGQDPYRAYVPPQGGYVPGSLVQAPPAPRKPLGPIALDPDLPEEHERGVWKCLAELDEHRAAAFGRSLAEGGFPIAASVVNVHVWRIREARAVIAAQEKAKREAMNGEKANGHAERAETDPPPPASVDASSVTQ